jgi:hypothetical protein
MFMPYSLAAAVVVVVVTIHQAAQPAAVVQPATHTDGLKLQLLAPLAQVVQVAHLPRTVLSVEQLCTAVLLQAVEVTAAELQRVS